MTAEANRRLLLPPSLSPTEHLEQAAAAMSAPTLWVRGTAGERTRLPGKAAEPKPGLQIQIALPIASSHGAVSEPPQAPPPPQVVFRTQEVIPPPPVSDYRDALAGPPGSAPSDPVDAPPGLADHPPGFEEDHAHAEEAPALAEPSAPAAPDASVVLETSDEPVEAIPEQIQAELRATPRPVLPSDYYEGAPGTSPLDPVDAPPGLADEPPGFDEHEFFEDKPSVLSEPSDNPPLWEEGVQAPPIRPKGKPLNLPPVAHHQVGASMDGPSKIAPPVRPLARVEEPPAWKPYEEAESQSAAASPQQEDVASFEAVEPEEASEEPPGLEMDALDELEADMQLFGDLPEHTEFSSEPDSAEAQLVLPAVPEEPLAQVLGEELAPRSVAAEAVDSAWQGRPLSERLAAGSLVVFGGWAVWKVWSVL